MTSKLQLATAVSGVLGVICLGAVIVTQAQGQAAMKVEALRDGKVYRVIGGGGNSGFVIGDKGVIVIDAKTTPEAAKSMLDEIKKITPKPVTHVILTHSDGDHTNGLPAFPANVEIIAHRNNREEQRSEFAYAIVEVNGGVCMPPLDRQATQVVDQPRVATKINGEDFVLHYFGPAHTSGDLIVELPAYRMAFTGDIIADNLLIHLIKAGSLNGWFTNVRGALALNVDQYIGGHSDAVDTKETLRKRMDAIQAQRDEVVAMKKKGMSLAEIIVARKDAIRQGATHSPYGAGGCRGVARFTMSELAYYAEMDKDSVKAVQ